MRGENFEFKVLVCRGEVTNGGEAGRFHICFTLGCAESGGAPGALEGGVHRAAGFLGQCTAEPLRICG